MLLLNPFVGFFFVASWYMGTHRSTPLIPQNQFHEEAGSAFDYVIFLMEREGGNHFKKTWKTEYEKFPETEPSPGKRNFTMAHRKNWQEAMLIVYEHWDYNLWLLRGEGVGSGYFYNHTHEGDGYRPEASSWKGQSTSVTLMRNTTR